MQLQLELQDKGISLISSGKNETVLGKVTFEKRIFLRTRTPAVCVCERIAVGGRVFPPSEQSPQSNLTRRRSSIPWSHIVKESLLFSCVLWCAFFSPSFFFF